MIEFKAALQLLLLLKKTADAFEIYLRARADQKQLAQLDAALALKRSAKTTKEKKDAARALSNSFGDSSDSNSND